MTELLNGQPTFPRLFTYRSDSDETPERRWPNLPEISLGWKLLGMLLLCLIPRVWMAYLTQTICHDGFYYFSTASALEDGDWARALAYLNLNIYPLILWGLHSLGLEWILAGKVWSILVSSFAVLPLFGWVRRLFSDQVAWASCFLYSLHAEFVERSFEPIRDTTFWLLFNLCLYTTLRAVTEAKPRWFLANGLVLTLAIHTRSEGWLLFIPLALWLVRQGWVKVECRKRLLGGTAICLAVLPCVILLINLTILRDEAEWHLGRLNHFVIGWNWLEQKIHPTENSDETSPADTPASTSCSSDKPGNTVGDVSDGPAPRGSATPKPTTPPTQKVEALASAVPTTHSRRTPQLKNYFKEMATALEQINLGLLVFALCWSGRELLDWNRGVLFVLAFAMGGAIWIVYNTYGHLNGRYFLTIYLALIPYFGIGFLVVFYGCWNAAEHFQWAWLKPEHTAIFLILLAIGLGWIDALITDHRLRDNEVAFGDWLEKTHGPFYSVVTDPHSIRSAYYAQNDVPFVIQNWTTLNWQYPDQPRDLIILSCKTTPPEAYPFMVEEARKWGLEPVIVPKSVVGCDEYWAFTRPHKSASVPIIAAEPQENSRKR